jgi:hypothetical protein
MPSSAGKRERERQKVEKAQAKAERKAARKAAAIRPEDSPSSVRSEAELIDALSALYQGLEAGEITPDDFEIRRRRLQAEFEQFS